MQELLFFEGKTSDGGNMSKDTGKVVKIRFSTVKERARKRNRIGEHATYLGLSRCQRPLHHSLSHQTLVLDGGGAKDARVGSQRAC